MGADDHRRAGPAGGPAAPRRQKESAITGNRKRTISGNSRAQAHNITVTRPFLADVFLSYSSKDRQAAERVERALSARGIEVFWDKETPPGVDWDTWIRGKLAKAKVAVVLWSKNSIASPNVRHEAIVARDAGKLVPAMIETLSPSDFPMGLYLLQGIQLQDWRDVQSRGIERLVAEVQARLGRGTDAGTAPPTPGKIAAVKKPSRVSLVLAGLVVAAVLGTVGWLVFRPDRPGGPAAVPETTVAEATSEPSCPDGSVPSQGVCASGNGPISPAPSLGTPWPAADTFSQRILGHWHWDGQACQDGTDITLEDGKLIFATKGEPRFVHVIESDAASETHTRVLSPEFDAGQRYSLAPEFTGTGNVRNFNLILVTGDEVNTWYRC